MSYRGVCVRHVKVCKTVQAERELEDLCVVSKDPTVKPKSIKAILASNISSESGTRLRQRLTKGQFQFITRADHQINSRV